MKDPQNFIRSNTKLSQPSAVPELNLWLASEVTPLWQATESWLDERNCAPPYWAFAWAGGQGLARYVLDHAEYFRGKRVVDFATGCGIAALAAAKAGASQVTGTEIDSMAITAAQMNADENKISAEFGMYVMSDKVFMQADVILAADICYEPAMTEHLTGWLRQLAKAGKRVFLADPGRTYLPKSGLEELTSYLIPTSFDLENTLERHTVIYRLLP